MQTNHVTLDPADEMMPATNETVADASAVVITCSALYRDITNLCRANGWSHLDVQCITAELHNRPEKITGAVKELIDAAKQKQQDVFVAYGDCGTGGQLDTLLEAEGVDRIPGAHCYEFFSGADRFAEFSEAEIGTFYLTDFLVRHFDRLVIRGLGIDKRPELESMYFGHYRKLLYIAQSHDPDLVERAKAAAERLGVEYEYFYGGSGELGTALEDFNRRIAVELKD
ncbi:MAG: DUF1638 domain-containing protein [Amphritea sp.]|nr:DUF1638 domain-containing protein [Amphritea sp.]